MPERIDRLGLTVWLYVNADGLVESVDIDYVPMSASDSLDELSNSFSIGASTLEHGYRKRLQRVIDLMASRVARREFQLGSDIVPFSRSLAQVWWNVGDKRVHAGLQGSAPAAIGTVEWANLSEAQRRLLDSVGATAEKLAWQQLRKDLGASAHDLTRAEVFVSYRASTQHFAEALARRLGQEGIVPFFDRWDVKAGDSVPGKIEEAFARSIACIVILCRDFKGGQWATTELALR